MKYLREHWGDVVMLGLIVLLGGAVWFEQSQKSLAGGNFNNVKIWSTVSATPYYNHAAATTSQTNLVMVGNASSTYAFATDSSDQVNFNLFGVSGASSTPDGTVNTTALDLIYCYAFSDDQVNWFPITSNCASWTPALATSTLNIPITNVNSKFMKIDFSSSIATSTRVGFYGEAIGKKGY